jgi:hypothetical protein
METWRVIRNDVYNPLSLEVVAGFVQREIDLCYTQPTLVFHPTLEQVMDGPMVENQMLELSTAGSLKGECN